MRELIVHLRFAADDVRRVGTLAEDRGRVWFEFDTAFREAGVEISPYGLPLARGALVEHVPKHGVPIPGVFNDARPEGWGLKLLHRLFQQAGRPSSAVSPLEELAFLGDRTMGALTFEPSTGPAGDLDDVVQLVTLARQARAVYDDAVEVVLPELVRAGGSPGGARPKALIGLREDGGPGVRFGDGPLPDGWLAWLVKFPASDEDTDVGRREQAWMAMARAAGVEVPDTRVLRLEGVGDAFCVRRFDRPGGGRRLHVLSAAGALDVDFRTALVDYRSLLRLAGFVCAQDQSQVVALFRLAAFNVAAVNEDDHLKNLAWALGPGGTWRLAPAFDLTYAPHPSGHRSTPVMDEDRAVGRAHLEALAADVGIARRTARKVLDEVVAATSEVRARLREAGCDNTVSHAAGAAVEAATARLGGS